MHKVWRSALVSVIAAACVVAMATTASAASKTTASKDASSTAASGTPAPLAQGSISVQVSPGTTSSETVAIVGVSLAPSMVLPVRVDLPLPVGATVSWAGEILGGDPSADPQREYTIHDGSGGAKYVEFTVTQSHQAQIETLGSPPTISGKTLTIAVDYVQSVPGTSTDFSVRMPAGVGNVKTDPATMGAVQKNSAGETLYSLGGGNLMPGSKQKVSVSYTQAGVGGSSAASSQTPIFVVLGILLVVAVIAVTFLMQRRPQGVQEADEDDDEGDYPAVDSSDGSDADPDDE